MFGRFALPTDDRASLATSITASDPDAEYPASNLVAASNTGHLNLPSRPAKLDALEGYFDLAFSSPITILAAAMIYHNCDENLDVTLELGSGSPFATIIQMPTEPHHPDGWTVSSWVEFSPVSVDAARLSFNEPNSINIQVGRLMLLAAIRDIGNDVRWGVVESEEHGRLEHRTELGVETLYDLGGKRRAINGEIALLDSTVGDFISIYRQTRSRVQPWLLVPDAGETDAWLVRFEDPGWSRTLDNPDHNIFPFRVKEVSRGLPFP